MARFELPSDLTPEEERLVLAALEHALGLGRPRPSPWVLAGRTENLRMGRLQARRESGSPWTLRANIPWARRATSNLHGRGDAK